MPDFCHLHCHTSYSLLDGAARIDRLVDRAAELNMKALGISDHGNLFGVPEFHRKARERGIHPVIGCEFYFTRSGMHDKLDRKRYHQILWAKNETGYRHLIKLSSLSYLAGFYYKPRIDFETLANYSEGLVATTCCLQGEVPQAILAGEVDRARRIFKKYLDVFGRDYYVEIQDHGLSQQAKINPTLLSFAKEFNVEVVATNDVHYVMREDAASQEILLCLQTGKQMSDADRLTFGNGELYLKTAEQMIEMLGDEQLVAPWLEKSAEIADECSIELREGDLLVPHFPIPAKFGDDADAYLKHLVFSRARSRYPDLGPDIEARLNLELGIIREKNYASYFLIVQDFTSAAREMDVEVGPGRGSAAGSVVAYCLGITNIDPLKYGLLFERFLNLERDEPPDIDIDFDDRGRSKVIDYVVNKYGRENVCQIVTFGTMGARTVIRDVARVLGISLNEADRIAKAIPEGPKVELDEALKKVDELRVLKEDPREEIQQLLHHSQVLEGCARHTGVHAAGVIIAPGQVSDFVPVAKTKNKGEVALTTQYDGYWVGYFGLLKMDFLGLSTLTVLRDAVQQVNQNRGIEIDLNALPLDDPKTYQLFQQGDTTGIFQFESEGMRRALVELKPTQFGDLIAMNALYRPGPMQFIKNYVQRKHGQEEVTYMHPMLEPILKETYGLAVYQEQVMQIAQVMGGYSLGAADTLRSAMGKKKHEKMARERAKFVKGAAEKGIEQAVANSVFDQMNEFAKYGFNKCLAGSTEIINAVSGQPITIAALYRRGPAGFEVHALGPDGRFTSRPVTDVLNNGNRPVFEITTRLGRRVIATDAHRFLTPAGWKRLGALNAGDPLAAPARLGAEDSQRWSKARLIAAAERVVRSALKSTQRGLPIRANDTQVTTRIAVRLPQELFALCESDTEWFVELLRRQCGSHLLTRSFELARDMQRFLLRIGITVPVTRPTDLYRVELYGEDSATCCLAWDVISSIAPAGCMDTFDLTVADDHNFLANGLVVHNSHSAAYSLVAYQTAYLKANFTAEFMASAMSNVANDSKKFAVILDEARRLRLNLIPPAINQSQHNFTVEGDQIRFGLSSIKGVGRSAIEAIIENREAHGPAKSLYQLTKTLDLREVNKKTLECLIRAGALDELEGHRAQQENALERAIQHAISVQDAQRRGQASLFGSADDSMDMPEPALPECDRWSMPQKLAFERELAGFYISGHPLDDWEIEARSCATADLANLDVLNGNGNGKPVHTYCGVVTAVKIRTTARGTPLLQATLEDRSGPGELICFKEMVEKNRELLSVNSVVLVQGDVEENAGSVRVLVRQVIPLERFREEYIRKLIIQLDPCSVPADAVQRLAELCAENPGERELQFNIMDNETPLAVSCDNVKVNTTAHFMKGLATIFGANRVRLQWQSKT